MIHQLFFVLVCTWVEKNALSAICHKMAHVHLSRSTSCNKTVIENRIMSCIIYPRLSEISCLSFTHHQLCWGGSWSTDGLIRNWQLQAMYIKIPMTYTFICFFFVFFGRWIINTEDDDDDMVKWSSCWFSAASWRFNSGGILWSGLTHHRLRRESKVFSCVGNYWPEAFIFHRIVQRLNNSYLSN